MDLVGTNLLAIEGNSSVKISNVVKAITVCGDWSVLIQAGEKWRTNHCFPIEDV